MTDTEQQMRLTLVNTLRALQIIIIIMVVTAATTLFFPVVVWGVIASGALLLLYEWRIEKDIKKKMKEYEEEKARPNE